MKKRSTNLIFLSLFFVFTACNYGGVNVGPGSGYVPSLTLAQQFTLKLNNYYSATYGNEFTLIKEYGANAPDYAVLYDNLTGQYMAFNLSYYYAGMNINDYLNSSYSSDIVGNLQPIGGGLYYSSYYNVIFEESKGTPKDLEKAGHILEAQKVNSAAKKIAAEFGLSEKRGVEIAKLASQWNSLKGKRSLTEADANAFSKELLGFDLVKATNAYKKSLDGDKKELDDLFTKAAEVNDTTPERMNKIFNDLLKN